MSIDDFFNSSAGDRVVNGLFLLSIGGPAIVCAANMDYSSEYQLGVADDSIKAVVTPKEYMGLHVVPHIYGHAVDVIFSDGSELTINDNNNNFLFDDGDTVSGDFISQDLNRILYQVDKQMNCEGSDFAFVPYDI